MIKAASARCVTAMASDIESEEADMGRRQALLEARGLPSQLFGALGPRMHQLLLGTKDSNSSMNKVQQLLRGVQATGIEDHPFSTIIEMRQGRKRRLSPSGETERAYEVPFKSQRYLRSERYPNYREFFTGRNVSPTTRKPNRTRQSSDHGVLQFNRDDTLTFSTRMSLYTNFKSLNEEMDAFEVVRLLKGKGILDEDFYKKFKEIKTRREKVVALLAELDRLMSERNNQRMLQILPEFIKALEESDQDELATLMQMPPYPQGFKYTGSDVVSMFSFFHKAKDKIIETVEPRRFLDDVVTIQGINLQEYKDIMEKSEREDRARELVKTIISNGHLKIKIIKPMCDSYKDLYSKFKSSERTETASLNPIGTPVALTYEFPETVAQEDTNEHSHPMTEIRKLQQRLVDTTNDNPEEFERLQEEVSNDARLLLSRLSLSCIKFHLRTTSATSLEDLKECCRNGKAIAWLMSLLKPEDIVKMKELEATEGKLECYIDDENSKSHLFDETFEKCLCVLNRDTLERNLMMIQDDLSGLELPVLDVLLESKVLSKVLAKSMSNIKANTAESEMMRALIKFLQEEELPQTCFCLIEKELVRNMKTSTIQKLRGNIVDASEEVKRIKTNLKEHTKLLEEELDARWFLAYLKSRTEEKYMKMVRLIKKSCSRKSRTKPFVQFLCEEEDIEWFVKELEECSPHVLAVLSHQKSSSEAMAFRNAMLSIYDVIINEVEPAELKSHLRTVCMEELQFEDIEKIDGRRERAFFFMKKLFRAKRLERVHDVMDAFASKYTHIEKVIKDVLRKGTKQGLQSSKCQLLKIDITLPKIKERSTEQTLVGVSVEEEDESSSHTMAKKILEVSDKCSSEVALSGSSQTSSKKELMLYRKINTLKTAYWYEQREMISELQSSKEDNRSILNAAPKATKIGESTDLSNCKERMPDIYQDRKKGTKVEACPHAMRSVYSRKDPFTSTTSNVIKSHCISVCQEGQERSLKHVEGIAEGVKDSSTTDVNFFQFTMLQPHSETSVETSDVLKDKSIEATRNRSSSSPKSDNKNSDDALNKMSKELKKDKDVLSPSSFCKYHDKTGRYCFKQFKPEAKSVGSKSIVYKHRINHPRKQIPDNEFNEVYSYRHNSQVSGSNIVNYERQFDHFGQQNNNPKYWENTERMRWHEGDTYKQGFDRVRHPSMMRRHQSLMRMRWNEENNYKQWSDEVRHQSMMQRHQSMMRMRSHEEDNFKQWFDGVRHQSMMQRHQSMMRMRWHEEDNFGDTYKQGFDRVRHRSMMRMRWFGEDRERHQNMMRKHRRNMRKIRKWRKNNRDAVTHEIKHLDMEHTA